MVRQNLYDDATKRSLTGGDNHAGIKKPARRPVEFGVGRRTETSGAPKVIADTILIARNLQANSRFRATGFLCPFGKE